MNTKTLLPFKEDFYNIRQEVIKFPNHLPSALSQLPFIIYLLKYVIRERSYYNLCIGKVFGASAWYCTMKYFNIIDEIPDKKILDHEYFDFCDTTLGNSLGVAIGMYLANKKKTITVLSDSQFQIGTIQESLQFISTYRIPIQIIVDFNGLQLTSETLINKQKIIDILNSLNILVIECKYNNLKELMYINDISKPVCYIINTIKGFSVLELEKDPLLYHSTNNLEKYTLMDYQ